MRAPRRPPSQHAQQFSGSALGRGKRDTRPVPARPTPPQTVVRESRNPFRLRASESIEVDALFVKLFGPGVLELLKDANPLEGLHIIRSAPGGGKTTLLRMFTPGPLLHLHAQRTQDDCK